MIRRFSSAGTLVLMALAGCSQSTVIDKISPEGVSSAKIYFEMLRNHQYADIQSLQDKGFKDPDLPATLAGIAAQIPSENPVSEKTVGASAHCDSHACQTTVTLEYEFPSQWLLFTVDSKSEGGNYFVTGVRIQPLPESLEEANRFTLLGKSFFQYCILLLAILIPAFSIYVLVLCVRTAGLKRKWLWAVFILCGFGKLSVLWTTGQWGFQPFAFQIFAASATAQFYGPWVVAISAPIGAVWFWNFRPIPNLPESAFSLPVEGSSPTELSSESGAPPNEAES